KEVERGVNREARRPKTAIADSFDGGRHPALDPHLAASVVQKFCDTQDMQRNSLGNLGTGKIELTGRESLVETDFLYFHLLDTQQHGAPGTNPQYSRRGKGLLLLTSGVSYARAKDRHRIGKWSLIPPEKWLGSPASLPSRQ